jgi:hypothetical protein
MGDNDATFPLSRALRREKLREIRQQTPAGSVKIPGKGRLDTYKIPLEFLSYNPNNTRFLTQAKTLEARRGRPLSDENAEDVAEIERFIFNEKKDKNDSTIISLINDGQLQPGVVTNEGIILSGNRRFRLLNEIVRNPKYERGRDSARYFEAAIIDESLTKKAILRYESFYQYGTDDKVDYDPIQKYIGAKEQLDEGFQKIEIAHNFQSLTDGSVAVVDKWLSIYDLMIEYLKYIDEENVYTALETQEDAFITLDADLKSLRKGSLKAGWDYNKYDIDDYKSVVFNYIRLKQETKKTRLFKKIFLDRSEWETFSEKVLQIGEKANIADFETYRTDAADNEDEEQISKRRTHDFNAVIGDSFTQLLRNTQAHIEDKDIKEKPEKITGQIIAKLDKLQQLFEESPELFDNEDIRSEISKIAKLSGRLKQDVD